MKYSTPQIDKKFMPLQLYICGLLIALITPLATIQAATIELEDTPLFLGTSIQPNIMLLFDTSGSMRWRISSTNSNIRKTVAKRVVNEFVTQAENVNLCLSGLNSSSGAKILLACDDINDSTFKTTFKKKVNRLYFGGGTPLAEATLQIGRYFVGQAGTSGNAGDDTKGEVTATQWTGPLTTYPKDDDGNTYKDGTTSSVNLTSFFNRSPAYASSSISKKSPVAYSCQQNYILTITDGMPTGDIYIPTVLHDYDRDCVDNADCDGQYYDRKLSYFGSGNVNSPNYMPTSYPSTSSSSDYWDDVTAALYDVDLRPDIHGKTNISNYVIGFADETLSKVQLPLDAASNGNGLFIAAENGSDLLESLNSILDHIISQSGTVAGLSFSSASIQNNTLIFANQFNSDKWSGDILAYSLHSLDVVWSAKSHLDGLTDTAMDNRFIVTYDGKKGVPFTWRSLNSNQQNDLKMTPNGKIGTDEAAKLRLDFLRGVRSEEQARGDFGALRDRASRLGDFVHSSPVYVGKAASSWPHSITAGTGYSAFKSNYSNRTGMIYAGANDGMLHGFDASTGEERLAYIPNALFSDTPTEGLHFLTDPSYTHRYFIDLTPSISDVYMGNEWKTVLFGSMRSGGRGVFALDITDPSSFPTTANKAAAIAEKVALWEFTHPELGYTFSQPTVVKTNADGNGKTDRWAVIFGNGYNSDSEKAVLFILFLDNTTGNWVENSNFVMLEAGGSGNANGLSSPVAIDTDDDSIADRVYAGDRKGNMWAFDISSNHISDWGVRHHDGGSKTPLFSAGSSQPITSQPSIVRLEGQEGYLVMFGTGQYISENDESNIDQQTLYGVMDYHSGTISDIGISDLQQQTITSTGNGIRNITSNILDWSSKKGWYVELPIDGERVVVDPFVRLDTIFFNTLIPSTGVCDVNNSGWLMAIDFATGAQPTSAIFDIDGDGKVTDGGSDGGSNSGSDGGSGVETNGGTTSCIGDYCYSASSSASGVSHIEQRRVKGGDGFGTKRLSWQELVQ